MKVNISNYYMPIHDNQISIINAFIKSWGRVKIFGTENEDKYNLMVLIGSWDWSSNNSILSSSIEMLQFK